MGRLLGLGEAGAVFGHRSHPDRGIDDDRHRGRPPGEQGAVGGARPQEWPGQRQTQEDAKPAAKRQQQQVLKRQRAAGPGVTAGQKRQGGEEDLFGPAPHQQMEQDRNNDRQAARQKKGEVH